MKPKEFGLSQIKEPKESPKESKDAKGAGGKPRVYALAGELNLESKVLLDICKELGFTAITSQLKALEPEQVDAIKDRVKRGAAKTAAVAGKPVAAAAVLPAKVDARIPTIAKPKVAPKPTATPVVPPKPVAEVAALVEAPAEVAPPVVETPAVEAAVEVAAPVAAPLPKPTPKLLNPGKPMNLGSPRAAKPKPVEAEVVEVAPVEVAPPVVEAPESIAAELPKPEVPAEPEPVAAEAPVVAAPAPAIEEVDEPVAQPAAKLPVNRPPVLLPPRPPIVPPRPQVMPPQGTATRPQGMPNVINPVRPPMPQGARPLLVPSASGRTPPNPGPPRPAAFGPSGPIVAPGSGRTPPNPGPPRPAAFGPGGATAPQRPGSPVNQGPGQGPGPGGPNAPRPGAPAPAGGGVKSVKLTLEQIQRLRQLEQQKGRQKIDDVVRHVTAPLPEAPKPGDPAAPGAKPGFGDRGKPGFGDRGDGGGGGDDRRGGPGGPGGPGGSNAGAGGAAAGRDQRHKARQERGRGPGGPVRPGGSYRNTVVIGAGGRVDLIEQASGSRIKKHRGRQHVKPSNKVLTGKIDIAVPITVRGLSETIGMKAGEVILKLKNLTNSLYTINSNILFETAELIAIEKGIELVAKKAETAEDEVLRKLRESSAASDPANLVLRSPVVTIMGHVDHGKTSLLDRIRAEYGLESDVVSTEAGGITQVLRAWRVEKDGLSTTFLDTPGHEAFTKMRARGANVTDIAVIVVSAVDGIMPQTQEAVAHAKAADVDIIVAINKCDLPGAQPEKVKNRLYDMELVPEDMGGDVPVIFTSAITGQGIGELLDAIALLAEVGELKADPTLAGSGTCLEAYKEEDKGVVATFLVQNGTVRKGDIILCGSTYGRVRAMYDDLAQPIDEAGPSTPIKIIGLNDVPDADDSFYVVGDVSTAREIAGARADIRNESDRFKFSPASLDSLKEQSGKIKVSELKVILKAEARGSVEAIKKELEKLLHDEVRVRVLHAGIGAINESDVTLGLTSPDDTIILGFNVTSDDPAMKLAENRGIDIREYQIIYNLVDDVKAALEGRLKPIEEVVHLGRAVVRDTFKITKVGTIAGCYVTSGTIERSARVRVIRDGVVIFPQGEKVVGLDSLKRHKDDAKEVREGFECGAKITGFDDIKTGDVIEAYKIEIKQRTLTGIRQ